MKKVSEEYKKRTEKWFDERWRFTQMEDARPQEMSYYLGAVKALEFLGFDWVRDEHGKHTIY